MNIAYEQAMTSPCQPDNPSDEERHALFRLTLARSGRLDDYGFILRDLSPPVDITTIAPPGCFKGKHIAIVGGGLAGMAAAYELRKLGFDITIFEARVDRIGGRIYTWYFDSQKKLYGEFGAMRMPVAHETLWHYVNLFKLNSRPFIQNNPNALVYLQNVRVANDPQGLNVMNHIYPKYRLSDWEKVTPWQKLYYHGYEGPLLEAPSSVRREILQVKAEYSPYVNYWGGIGNRRMLENRNLSQGAINLLKNFAPLAGENLYNSYIDYAQEVYTADLSYLYEIPGGMATLPLAFYNSFANLSAYPGISSGLVGKVEWRSGCGVEGIYYSSERGVVVAYKEGKIPRRSFNNFDYVICAIPFSTLRTIDIQPLFDNRKMQAIREVSYINAEKAVMLCNRRFWESGEVGARIIGGVSYTDLPVAQIYYPSDHTFICENGQGGRPSYRPRLTNMQYSYNEPGVLYSSYNYSQNAVRLANMQPPLTFEKMKRNVEEVHGLPPGELDLVVRGFKVINWDEEPWSRGALCFYTPEQKQLFSAASALPEFDDHVFFAGEHISAKHRWMQGALKSGMEAANALADACRRNK